MLPRFLRDALKYEGAGTLGHPLHFSKHRVEKLGRSSQQVEGPSSGQLNLKPHAWPNNFHSKLFCIGDALAGRQSVALALLTPQFHCAGRGGGSGGGGEGVRGLLWDD